MSTGNAWLRFFPLRLREALSPSCVCTCGHASQGQKDRACLFNLKGQSSNKSHPVKLEKTSLTSVDGTKETQWYTQYVEPVSRVRAGQGLWTVQGVCRGLGLPKALLLCPGFNVHTVTSGAR